MRPKSCQSELDSVCYKNRQFEGEATTIPFLQFDATLYHKELIGLYRCFFTLFVILMHDESLMKLPQYAKS